MAAPARVLDARAQRTLLPMPNIIELIVTVVSWVFALMAIAGLVDAVRYPKAAFTFIGKIPKAGWLVMLGVSAVLVWWNPISIFGLAGIVAISVYFADVRRRIRALNGV